MIVDRIRLAWVKEAERRTARVSGTPSGSRFGACTAQLEQLMFPALTHPEPMQPRGVGVMEMGSLVHDYIATKVHAAWPGRWGLREQPFYLRVPIPEGSALESIQAKLRPRRPTPGDDEAWKRTPVWGWPAPGFLPPKIEYLGGRRLRIRGIGGQPLEESAQGNSASYPPTVVLDLAPADGAADPCVWVATYIDGLILHPEHGFTLVEVKSMSTPAFRRACLGDLDYGYRCQLLGSMRAVGVQHALWILLRKETSHLASVAFIGAGGDASAQNTRVTLTAPSGAQTAYVVADASAKLLRRGDLVAPFPNDSEWEAADIWAPAASADTLLPQIERRVLRALAAEPGRWHREYGPDFRCTRCGGEGTIACRYCQGSGVGLKSGKPCGACGPSGKRATGLIGRLTCTPTTSTPSCGGAGILDTAILPWQCSYCPVVTTSCWAEAGVQRVLETDRAPRHLVQRAAYEASGLTFEPPEPVEVATTADESENNADDE